jgi:3-hydroxypropanoate dehydrogenase
MLDDRVLDTLFRNARSQNGWRDEPVADSLLRELYDLVKLGPTSANTTPARFLFLRTTAAKERLRPFLVPANVSKVMDAPVTAVIGFDTRFYELLPRLFPHNQAARGWFASSGKEEHAFTTAFRNGTLQAGYFIMAARALGLDCGPLSGFDHTGVDREFWHGTHVRTNFLCALGHGDPSKVLARHPRLDFAEACTML